MTDQFANFFSDKITNIHSQFPTSVESFSDDFSENAARICEFEPATVLEVSKLIKSSPMKSCELDPAPTFLIDILAPVITIIMSKSFEQKS